MTDLDLDKLLAIAEEVIATEVGDSGIYDDLTDIIAAAQAFRDAFDPPTVIALLKRLQRAEDFVRGVAKSMPNDSRIAAEEPKADE